MIKKITIKYKDTICFKELKAFFNKLSPKVNRLFGWNSKSKKLEKRSLKNCLFITARIDTILIGFIRIVTDRAYEFYLSEVVVLPKYRGRGLGSKMMRRVITEAKKEGFVQVFLTADKGLEPYYEKFGFKKAEYTVMKIKGNGIGKCSLKEYKNKVAKIKR